MDALTPEQQAEIKKLSSERIRAKLVKAGYDKDAVFAFDRQQQLNTLAEFTLLSQLRSQRLMLNCVDVRLKQGNKRSN